MGKFKAIIFDYYGVISIRGHQAFLEKVIHDHATLEHVYELRRQRDLGMVSLEDFLAEVGTIVGQSAEEVAVHMRDERVINEPLVHFITTKLKPTYKIGLLSNAASDLHDLLRRGNLTDLFDDVVVSAEVGMIKPDVHIFNLACERLGAAPHETIMIDDIPDNCDGAHDAGLATICYHTFPKCREQLDALLQ